MPIADVPAEALSRLLTEAELVDVPDGGFLVRSGESSDALYILADGKAEVIVPGVPSGVMLAEGEILGETCLLPDVRRRADVVARGPLRTLRLPRAALERLIADYAAIVDRTTFAYQLFDVGHKPYWATNSGDGRYCFVSVSGDDQVVALDYRTRQEVARIPVGDHPQRMRMGKIRRALVR